MRSREMEKVCLATFEGAVELLLAGLPLAIAALTASGEGDPISSRMGISSGAAGSSS